MNPKLVTALVGRVGEMTRRNNQPAAPPVQPTAAARYVGASPIEEILVEELLVQAPKQLADALRTAPNVATVRDLAGAVALYDLVAHDPALANQYLATLRSGGQPRQAGLTVAKTIAGRLDPPPRTGLWLRLDQIGVGIQLLAAFAIVASRAMLFVVLTAYSRETSLGGLWSALAGIDTWSALRQAIGLELWVAASLGPNASAALSLAMMYAYFEFRYGSMVVEFFRGVPSRLFELPPPQPWRTSEFGVMFQCQSFAVLLASCWFYGRSLSTWLLQTRWSQFGDNKLALAGFAFAIVVVIGILFSKQRQET